MRVLLLGGTGFLGSALARQLSAHGHEVVTASSSSLADLRLDLRSPDSLEDYLLSTRYNTVINLAGAGLTSGTADVATMVRINSELPPRIFRALASGAASTGVHFIHAASSTERLPGQGSDESEYSRTKWAGTSDLEMEFLASPDGLRAESVHVSICRIHNTYGPGQPEGRFVAHVISQLTEGRPVPLRFPERVRDFVYLGDTVTGLHTLVDANMSAPQHAELGTGVGLRLREAAICIAHALDRPDNLVINGGRDTDDPNPVTVASERFGSLGNCRINFAEGIELTLKGA